MAVPLSHYGYLRIGCVSPELRVADPVFNADKIIEAIDMALEEKCRILCFPELSITSFSCGDLFFQEELLERTRYQIERIARHTASSSSTVIVGAPLMESGRLFACAVVISDGSIAGVIPKTFLSNSQEYYEERWFSSERDRISDKIFIKNKYTFFGSDLLFEIDGFHDCIFGVELCEDLWSIKPPSVDMASAGATLIFNLSASTEYLGKTAYRRMLVQSQSGRCISAYAYTASGPGESTTDAVFSGHSIIAENGKIIAESNRFDFKTTITITDIDIQKLTLERLRNNSFGATKPDKTYRKVSIKIPDLYEDKPIRFISRSPFVPSEKSDRTEVCKAIFNIQSCALSKRIIHMNCSKAVIGVSGGLDSTLALLATVNAFKKLDLKRQSVHAISMPGFGTSEKTKNNASNLCRLLGVSYEEIPIRAAVEQHFKDISHDPEVKNIVYENSQARERTQILMDIANKFNCIVVGTGDLSELALGWCTYGGDHISMYGINSGIPKTLVRYIIEYCAEEEFSGELSKILIDIANTPISPELLPPSEDGSISQETEEQIGPYILNDFFMYYFIREHFSPAKILFLSEIAFDGIFTKKELKERLIEFYRRFFNNQFKRSCLPDGVKIGTVSLSPRTDWRMPSDASVNLWLKELKEA